MLRCVELVDSSDDAAKTLSPAAQGDPPAGVLVEWEVVIDPPDGGYGAPTVGAAVPCGVTRPG